MKLVGIDVGRTTGIAVKHGDIYIEATTLSFKSLKVYHDTIYETLSKNAPSLIVCAYPTRFYRVIKFHSALLAIIELCAEVLNIPYIEFQDAHCKKVVIGKGNAKKQDIMEYFKEDNEHIADAKMFIETYEKTC